MYKYFTTILLFFQLSNLHSQETAAHLQFLKDSIKVGMPVEVALSVRYNKFFDVLLPDSTYDFSPFEYVGKRYFPTNTKGNISKDSTIYLLRSFELDSTLALSMKIYEVIEGDSLELATNPDSILSNFIVAAVPDSINSLFLRETTEYYRIPKQFNYPYFIAGSIVVILLLFISWLVVGERIKRYFMVRKLNRQYISFQKVFDQQLDKLTEENRFVQTEKLLVLWKNYMENLEDIPYSKLTTKEIRELKDDHLDKILKKLDEVIYARKIPETTQNSLEELRHYSSEVFNDKLNKIKHGIPN